MSTKAYEIDRGSTVIKFDKPGAAEGIRASHNRFNSNSDEINPNKTLNVGQGNKKELSNAYLQLNRFNIQIDKGAK